MDTVRGHLLVATPAIASGHFWRTVVLVLDHDDDGALGVIINRPLDSDVDDVLPEWADVVDAPVCLFDGGPVAMDSALAVGVLRGTEEPLGWRPMCGRIGLVDLDVPVPTISSALAGLRLFAGYAGWSPQQLDEEIDEGAWIVVPAEDRDLFSPVPEQLWNTVLRRQSGDLRYWATYPEDPSRN
ncbi:MAG: YqgE/AlgH family protein [Nocardioidaceae bacterium]|nr:YqgE/AlgH family protein [Nocardioidaceae bacterium]